MTFNGWTFAFEVINFLVLTYILYRLLYRPMLAAIDARRQAINAAQEAAATAQSAALDLQQKLLTDSQALEEQRVRILAEAREEAVEERARIVASATAEIARRRADEKDELSRQREALLHELQAHVVMEAVALSKRLLAEVGGEELDGRLVERLAAAVGNLPPSDRERLAGGHRHEDGALLEVAHATRADGIMAVRSALEEVMGEAIPVQIEVRPDLVSGARLHLDGYVWDASLQTQTVELDDERAAPATH